MARHIDDRAVKKSADLICGSWISTGLVIISFSLERNHIFIFSNQNGVHLLLLMSLYHTLFHTTNLFHIGTSILKTLIQQETIDPTAYQNMKEWGLKKKEKIYI
jgi:hypothetical protein